MKSEIIELFLDEYELELDRFIFNNLYHKLYFDDFKQEVLLKICEMDEYKLRSLFITDGMMNYTKRICLNMFNSKYQPYRKKLRQLDTRGEVEFVYSEEIVLEEMVDEIESIDASLELKMDWILNEMNEPDFFTQLFKYYITYGVSLDVISEDLKISKTTLFNRFNNVKKQIIEKWIVTNKISSITSIPIML